MIGLIVVIVATIYSALLTWATVTAYRWAKKRGLSKGRRCAVAAGAFLAIYPTVFRV
jgi:hypothetical protein